MGDTKIDWCDKVWNPVTGCTKISEGCRNCYAERMSKRLAGRAGYPEDGFKVTLHPEKLEEPLRWKKPSRIFVCSMGDLFHEAVDIGSLTHIFDMMEQCPQHTFLVLTKRPARIKEMMYAPHGSWRYFAEGQYHPNIWLGVSVEDQKTADERIPLLLQTPATKRFVSYEPALGPIDFKKIGPRQPDWRLDALCGYSFVDGRNEPVKIPRLDWIIMGGESGPGARPMHSDWARSTRDQCKAAGVPFFFKQWGEWVEGEACKSYKGPPLEPKQVMWAHNDGTFSPLGDAAMGKDLTRLVCRVGKKAAGCLLDGKEYKGLP